MYRCNIASYFDFFYLLYRPYWRCYFLNTQAIIYVVDSSDTDRLVTTKDEFDAIVEVWTFVVCLLIGSNNLIFFLTRCDYILEMFAGPLQCYLFS